MCGLNNITLLLPVDDALQHIYHLQEAGDVPLVADPHRHHVLKQPEKRPLVSGLRSSLVKQAVELEEQSPGSLCRRTEKVQPPQHESRERGEFGERDPRLTVKTFSCRVDNGQVVAGASSDHQVERSPLLDLTGRS